MSKRFVNERELSQYSGIAVRTLQRQRIEEPYTGPPYAKFGGSVRYDLEAFERWAAERTIQPANGK